MSHDFYTFDELVALLNEDRKSVEKMVSRGRVPARRVAGDWRFNKVEITHWLEQKLREYDDENLAQLELTHQSEELDAAMPVSALLTVDTVEVPMDARTKPSVLQTLVEVAGRTWHVWEPATVLEAVKQREEVMSTGFEHGVAIPHARNPLPEALGESIIAFGRTTAGIPFGAPKRQLTDMFFLVLARDARTHLQILARLGRLLQHPDFVDNLRATQNSVSAYDLICSTDEVIGG